MRHATFLLAITLLSSAWPAAAEQPAPAFQPPPDEFDWMVDAEYFKDPFQNIAHRETIGAALGYQLVDTARVEVDRSPGRQHDLHQRADR